jgi:hypothetical protein
VAKLNLLLLAVLAPGGKAVHQCSRCGRRGRGCELSNVYWRDGIWYCQQAEAQRATPSLFDLEEAA